MRYDEPQQENLLEELTRLVGRPKPVLEEAVTRLLGLLMTHREATPVTVELSPYPMTAWRALAPQCTFPGELEGAFRGLGLTAEEVFTALAVIDDHVRRTYGNDAWERARDWSHRLALRYDLSLPHAPIETALATATVA